MSEYIVVKDAQYEGVGPFATLEGATRVAVEKAPAKVYRLVAEIEPLLTPAQEVELEALGRRLREQAEDILIRVRKSRERRDSRQGGRPNDAAL